MKLSRITLIPVSWLYGCAVIGRNWCYDLGIIKTTRVTVPVISVGNMTAGGTGKTPFVEYLLRGLLEKKKKIAVISRGYKRTTSGTVVVSDGVAVKVSPTEAGDEPFQIAKKFPGVIVIVDEKRSRAAKLTVVKFGVDVILLDDGFQHRSLRRDIDVVMIDGREPLEEIPLLPAGMRREPLSSLRRADIIAVSKPERLTPQVFIQSVKKPVVKVTTVPFQLCGPDGNEIMKIGDLKGKPCVGFCGIGNPASFRATLEKLGLAVTEFLTFPDHHWYTERDLEHLTSVTTGKKTKLLITTEKDAVRILPVQKLRDLLPAGFSYITIRSTAEDSEGILNTMFDRLIR